MATTIQISDGVKQRLDKMRIFQKETYNEVIEFLLEDTMELNERTKKEIEESKRGKSISHEEVKRRLGL